MAKVDPYYSIKKMDVYHDNGDCTEGNNIEPENKRPARLVCRTARPAEPSEATEGPRGGDAFVALLGLRASAGGAVNTVAVGGLAGSSQLGTDPSDPRAKGAAPSLHRCRPRTTTS